MGNKQAEYISVAIFLWPSWSRANVLMGCINTVQSNLWYKNQLKANNHHSTNVKKKTERTLYLICLLVNLDFKGYELYKKNMYVNNKLI